MYVSGIRTSRSFNQRPSRSICGHIRPGDISDDSSTVFGIIVVHGTGLKLSINEVKSSKCYIFCLLDLCTRFLRTCRESTLLFRFLTESLSEIRLVHSCSFFLFTIFSSNSSGMDVENFFDIWRKENRSFAWDDRETLFGLEGVLLSSLSLPFLEIL